MPSRTRAAGVSVVTLLAFLPLALGCTSNEYVIPHEELARLAATPPGARGARVRVVQEVGERRGYPVPVAIAPPSPEPVTTDDEDDEGDQGGQVDLQIDVSGGRRAAPRGPAPSNQNGSWSSAGRSGSRSLPAAPPRGPVGSGAGRAISGGHVGGGGHIGGGGSHIGGGGHVGGGGSHGGGGGGGGDAGAAVAMVVAIVVVVAVVVAIGLVSGEGVRFDGYVAMSPEQPVHLRAANGQQATIPMTALSPEWVAGAVEAKVMDDEGFGIERLDRLPLDRRGGTFKLDSGTIAFDVAGVTAMGPAMHVQAGYFITRKLGLLANLSFAGASVGQGQGFIPRHAFGLELQGFPLALGPLHLGAFGNAGMALTEALVGGTPTYVNGPSVGGGALAELDLTSRLALTLRAGADVAKLDQVWTPAGLLTAGVAVY